jgi:hypothetical protein
MALSLRHRLHSTVCTPRGSPFWRKCAIAGASVLFFCTTASVSRAQASRMLCSTEGGKFDATFRTGVGVHVGPVRNGELATRRCEAELSWGKERVVVAPDASQIDVDVLGADLGLGVPVVSFQIKKSGDECCTTYQIYSLQKPPALLRTLRGGEHFSAADTDLDGRVEIWTDDTAAVAGFDNLSPQAFDLAPTVVLRFQKGRLLDVGSEFRPAFDENIAKLRATLDSNDLLDFKSSDGKLAALSAAAPPEAVHRRERQQSTKVKVLEIVWAYLCSGREQEAWNQLADMWPDADLSRVRAPILDALTRGMRAQVDGVSTLVPRGARQQTTIFEDRPQLILPQGRRGWATTISPSVNPPFTPPIPIIVLGPPGASPKDLVQTDIQLELVIDSAGKIRSVAPVKGKAAIDPAIRAATEYWKFIPGFHDNQAIACRGYFTVSLQR